MSQFLKKMRDITLERVALEKKDLPELSEKMVYQQQDFLGIFKQPGFKVIAEIKFASPSLGLISESNQPSQIAGEYLNAGAHAISILTEPTYFKGSVTYLKKVRESFPHAKILMKDFILDEHQLLQACYYGADAVLLIAAFLTKEELQSLYHKAINHNLTPLVEVHTRDELEEIKKLGAKLIGVNNRNLNTLEIDLATSHQLSSLMDDDSIFISESGIKSYEDMESLYQKGYQGFLIGSHLMKSKHPGHELKKLLRN